MTTSAFYPTAILPVPPGYGGDHLFRIVRRITTPCLTLHPVSLVAHGVAISMAARYRRVCARLLFTSERIA
ncbi:hypothetical protein [Herbaspirillum autotrophicum]|uniref:hypothetical protein n=1 Tax=Herbaspirillum autotrophicum TaxID=180195 RepID=UPI0012ED20DC|nr:hypothetical protein [Herbaspirillum autotrophicum]